ATDLARALHADCTLVRVMPPLVRGQNDPVDVTLSHLDRELLDKLTALHEDERAATVAYLDSKAAQLRSESLDVHSRLLVHDDPAAALLEEAEKLPADLVALVTHGRGGLSQLFLGSTADKIVRGVHCPVVIYRPTSS